MRISDFLKTIRGIQATDPQKPVCVEVLLKADPNFVFQPRLGIRKIELHNGNDGTFMFVIHATKHDSFLTIELVEKFLTDDCSADSLKTYNPIEMVVNVHGKDIAEYPFVDSNGQAVTGHADTMTFHIVSCINEPMAFVIKAIDRTGAPGNEGI